VKVELNALNDSHIIFVDHVTYGRPFYMEGSLSSELQACKRFSSVFFL
jgi:hypothetical protein